MPLGTLLAARTPSVYQPDSAGDATSTTPTHDRRGRGIESQNKHAAMASPEPPAIMEL
ncbi:MAG: hypothetical protein WKF47_01265 [Geodermatophilaceae bacterium]